MTQVIENIENLEKIVVSYRTHDDQSQNATDV